MAREISSCQRCGRCCQQGGPALHSADLELVKTAKIPISNLITIRKGELVSNPLTNRIQPVSVELVKLVGSGRNWSCCYYDTSQGCTVYDHRPLACRVLKCWDTREISALVEKDTLDRLAILDSDHRMLPFIAEHERICPCAPLHSLRSRRATLTDKEKKEIEAMVRSDLRFRVRVIEELQLKLSEELFYFGRPYFQLLQPLGIGVVESDNDIHLNW